MDPVVRGPARLAQDFRNFQINAGRQLELFATSETSAVTTLGDQAEQLSVGLVTGNYYSVLGVRPILGRLLDREDSNDTDPHLVAVLDYDFWRRRFGGDPHRHQPTDRAERDLVFDRWRDTAGIYRNRSGVIGKRHHPAEAPRSDCRLPVCARALIPAGQATRVNPITALRHE
jgi:hypothetical protein